MDFLKQITDLYDRNARLYPALLVLWSPLTIFLVFADGSLNSFLSVFTIVLETSGFAFLMIQLARDNGKSKEMKLFKIWGGMPSVAIFRHRDANLNTITKQRYHKAMANLVVETSAQTIESENENSEEADKVYSAWSNYLRTHTRDKMRFPLVFAENVNYGYRRNVWGMKSWGISLSLLSALIVGIGNPSWLYFHHDQKFWQTSFDPLLLCAFVLSVGLLLFWIFKVNSDWVKIPADAYAYRLIESIDVLISEQQTDTQNNKPPRTIVNEVVDDNVINKEGCTKQ